MKALDTARRNEYYHCLEYDQDQLGDLYLIACGQEQCDPGITYGPDVRVGYHLHVVQSGKGTLRAAGSIFPVHEGQMFLLKHGEEVRYTADREDPWSYSWVTFWGSEAKSLVKEIGFEDGIYVLDSAREAKEFHYLILRMMKYPEMNLVSNLRRKGILMAFLALAMEAAGRDEAQHKNSRPMEDYIQRAETFIRYNYASIQVADVVRYVGFTRAYFSTAFKAKTGLSIKDYLTKIRMEKAKSLLGSSDLTVREIAESVGYPDSLHFSRVFHQWCGVSPSQYRKELR